MAFRHWLYLWAWLFLSGHSFAANTLTLENNGKKSALAAPQLANRSDARTIALVQDPAYRARAMQYHAIPLTTLLQEHGFQKDDTVQFVALDGFVATLPARLLLATPDMAQPWLAIEPSDKPWPPLSANNASSAGPFYLIWTSPEKSRIRQEQWPYQISRIERVDSLEKRFPQLAPRQDTPADSAVWTGFEVFKTQCSVCHRMNGGGEASIGPDLNIPLNPTEYFQPDALKQLIRNPAQVRTWPGSKMPAFSKDTLSDEELEALIAYLQAMTANRK